MKLSFLLRCILLTLGCSLVLSVDHEKSFLLQDGAGSVQAIAFYQESLLLTSTNDVVQRDIKTGKIQRTFRGHTNQIYFVTVTEDFRMITSGWDDMIMVWDLNSATLMKRIWLGSSFTYVTTVAFIPNQVFTGGFDQKLRQVDLTTGRVLRTIGNHISLIDLNV
jgi:WD40 repeat protein